MDFLKVNKILNDFGKYVVQQSKSNLTKDKKGNGALYNSIKYKLDSEKDIFLLDFLMENYGDFVDQGVKGKDPSKVSPNAKIKGQQAPNSQFKFGSGSMRGTFNKFALKMSVFAKSKNIRFRQGSTGKFAKGNYKSMGYVIARNIYNRGLKPTMFFTKPFEQAFKRLTPELTNAYLLDIEQAIILGTKK